MTDSDLCRTKWLAFLRLSEKNLDQSVFCSRCTDCKFLLVFSAFLWFFLPFSEMSATGVLVPLKAIPDMIRNGSIQHSLVLVSFALMGVSMFVSVRDIPFTFIGLY